MDMDAQAIPERENEVFDRKSLRLVTGKIQKTGKGSGTRYLVS